ncbi:MAG: hypothetical protein ACOZE5_03130 [Verrucomicrobiota bacterium]
MPQLLRRLLNLLPLPQGGSDLYVRSTWHKPTPFDQWRSQAPFRPLNKLRADHFGRSLRRRRLLRGLLRWGLMFVVAWLVLESTRAFVLL